MHIIMHPAKVPFGSEDLILKCTLQSKQLKKKVKGNTHGACLLHETIIGCMLPLKQQTQPSGKHITVFHNNTMLA